MSHTAHSSAWPSRRCSLDRLLRTVEAWHTLVSSLPDSLSASFVPEIPLPPAPVPSRTLLGVEVCAISSMRALHAEGVQMRHCVAHLAPEIVRGRAFAFHAQVHDQPVTIHVRRLRPDRYVTVEAAGFANARPLHPALIARWVASLRDPVHAERKLCVGPTTGSDPQP